MSWNTLEKSSQIENLVEASHSKPQLIFKNSPICGISASAYRKVKAAYEDEQFAGTIWEVDVVGQRDLSREIANFFMVKHQSPQILLIVDGEAVYATSHFRIKRDKILEKWSEFTLSGS